MIDAAVIILCVDRRLPWAALAVIVARDALLLAGTKLVLPRGYDFSVNLLGKAATWVLYAGIGFLVADRWRPNWPLWLFWIGLGLAIGAAVVYAGSAWRALRR
jgi:phosphatidylglycerophosphate synthase